jgi:hypothetical protein
LFLLVTAGLKLHGLVLDPLAGDSFLASPRLQIAAIEVEVLLGLWLLSGWQLRGARYVAIAFFGILAAASLWLGLAGQSSCGCFGRIEVNPWATFALDSAIFAALAFIPVTPPQALRTACEVSADLETLMGDPRRGTRPRFLTASALLLACAAVMLALIAGTFFLAFDNPVAALAHIRGEMIAIDPVVADLGDGMATEWREFQVQVTNHGQRTVRIVGGTDMCLCRAIDDLPVSLLPQQSSEIKIRMMFHGSNGRFLHRCLLYTDDHCQPVVVVRYAGRVTSSTSQ